MEIMEMLAPYLIIFGFVGMCALALWVIKDWRK